MKNALDRAIEISRARRDLPPPPIRRHIRESAGVSQRALARELGVDIAQVSRWEAGLRNPRGDNALAYAAVLKRLIECVP